MRVQLDLQRTLEENASSYFERAKKARHKLDGVRDAMQTTEKRLADREREASDAAQRQTLKRPDSAWYKKYRWSRTRNGHLIVGGQNASANETLVKHHADQGDYVFHTDMAGSPFVILKPEGEVTDEDLEDGATFCGCYSRGWGKGMASIEVFWVRPEQVTKEAQSGEFLAKGSFMIRGETTYVPMTLELGVGVIEREGYRPEVFAGSPAAAEKHCSAYARIAPGDEKTSDTAKRLRKRFGGELDDFVRVIPAGGSRLLK